MVTLELDLTTLAISHQPIVDAISAGDVELAARVSREHQAWFEELLAARAQADTPQADDKAATAPLAAAPSLVV